MKQLLIRQDDAVMVEQMVVDINKLEDEYSMGGDKEIDDLDSTVQEVTDNDNTNNNEVHQYLEPSNVVSAATATVPHQNIEHTAQKPRAPAHIHAPTSILKATSSDRSIIEPHATRSEIVVKFTTDANFTNSITNPFTHGWMYPQDMIWPHSNSEPESEEIYAEPHPHRPTSFTNIYLQPEEQREM